MLHNGEGTSPGSYICDACMYVCVCIMYVSGKTCDRFIIDYHMV